MFHHPKQQLKAAGRGTHSSCPSSCEQPALTPAVPGHKNGREKAENYTNRGSATAEGEVVTAVGLRDAVLKLIRYCLIMQIRVQLNLMNDFIQIAATLKIVTAARAGLCQWGW